MPERIAHLWTMLKCKLAQVATGTTHCTLYVYVFYPLHLCFLSVSSTRNLYFIQGWQMTKTRDGSVPFDNSVEAETITQLLITASTRSTHQEKVTSRNWSHNALSSQRPASLSRANLLVGLPWTNLSVVCRILLELRVTYSPSV